jgi:Alcohol dehydrogenase GroES-like domain
MTTAAAVATMKAAQVTEAGAGLRIVELEIPDPGPGQVRIKVQACGVYHSDAIIVEGLRPGIPYPRVPGHEVAGVVDALGTRRGFDPRRPQPRGSPEVTTLNRAAPSRSHRTPRLPTSIPKYWKRNHLNTRTSHSSFDFTLIGNLCGQLASSYQGISDTFVQWRRVPACGIIASTH